MNEQLKVKIDELLFAARDMLEQVGAYIDLDDKHEDPTEHDLFDCHKALHAAVEEYQAMQQLTDTCDEKQL